MTDIFLSYNEKDREQARRVATMLESVGWTIWWDRRIPAGETWRSVLEDALEDMRCMVVLWSAHSIESEWVYEEASEGRRLGKLIPVMIEPVRPPAGFREIQAADLTNWDGTREFEGMRMLLADLESFLGKPAQVTDVKPEPEKRQEPATPWWQAKQMVSMAVAGAVLLVGGAGLSCAVVTTTAPKYARNFARNQARSSTGTDPEIATRQADATGFTPGC